MSVEGQSSIGKIIYLAGPSSSGKSTYSNTLIDQGWIHLEADHELSIVDAGLVAEKRGEDMAYVKSHLVDQSPENILSVIQGKAPDITPSDKERFKKACEKMKAVLDQKWLQPKADEKNWQEVFIHMLDEAKRLAELGKNVIIDYVPLLNELPLSHSDDLSLQQAERENIWAYKGVQMEQKLKFATVDRLMANVIKRNQEPKNHRNPVEVIQRYADWYHAAQNPSDPNLGTHQVQDLAKWIERAVKMKFFDIDPDHCFVYREGEGDLDRKLQERVDAFIQELKSLENSTDPELQKLYQEKSQEAKKLPGIIAETTREIFNKMKIPDGALTVDLTYSSVFGVRPTVV